MSDEAYDYKLIAVIVAMGLITALILFLFCLGASAQEVPQEMSPLYNVACRKNNSVTTTRNG